MQKIEINDVYGREELVIEGDVEVFKPEPEPGPPPPIDYPAKGRPWTEIEDAFGYGDIREAEDQ